MSEGAAGVAGAGGFAASRAVFGQLTGWLDGGEAAGLTAAQLEDRVAADGRELLRQLLQDHLDLRAAREQRIGQVTGSDGVARTRAERGHARPLATVVGQVTVTRMAYRAPGAPNLHPADAALNLPEEKHSHGLRRLAAVEAARGSFESARDAVARATGARVGKRQLEQLGTAAAADISSYYAQRRPGPRDDGILLVLSFDGKGIVMRPEALRPGTARAAARARRKLATRLTAGEKNGRKRMAELAVVYDAGPAPRTPAGVIRPPGTAGDGAKREPGPKAEGKWLAASVTDDIAAVVAAGFSEAARRDPGHARTWVVLVDGNKTQIDAVTAEAAAHGVTVKVLIDFVHVLEYLWKAAWSFYPRADPAAEQWVAAQAAKILDGKATQVAAGIRRRVTRQAEASAARDGAGQCARYLTAKQPWLNYPAALKGGWPIATGVIEGACRWLVKDRMDITGARWGLAGAEAILKLRALIACSDFDDYWRYHLQQEHKRVHQARYRDSLQLAA